jgi:hypothetical protein
MTPKEHLEFQKKLANKIPQTLVVPPGTENLPLAERLHIYLAVFESGCSITQFGGKPEDCPECVRAFVDAVKHAVDEGIAANPLEAMKHMLGAVDTKPVQ